MIIFELLSAIAAILAGLPELYFYLKLRKEKGKYAVMSLSIFLAFFLHALAHILHYMEIFSILIYLSSVFSAVMVLLFAIIFYQNQKGEVNGS